MSVKNDCKESNNSNKNSLRTKHKLLRKEIFSIEKNNKIIQNLISLDVYKKAKNIMAFYPLPYEIDLRDLFIKNIHNKEWYLPKYENGDICPLRFKEESCMVQGAFKIMEPSGNSIISPELLDVIILPALAVDKTGNRLGYGKGCYDRFIAGFQCNAKLIVPIFNDLLTEEVPSNSFDKKIDIIVSEREVIVI